MAIGAILKELRNDDLQAFHSHKHDPGSFQIDQRLEIDCPSLFGRVLMPCEYCECGGCIAMGQWDPGIGRNGNRRSHPWNDLKSQTRGSQSFCFFTSSAEDKRIASFQTYNPFSLFGFVDQQLVDILLPKRMLASFLSYIDEFGVMRRPLQNLRVAKVIVHNHLRLFDDLFGVQSEQPDITGTCSNKTAETFIFLLHKFCPEEQPQPPWGPKIHPIQNRRLEQLRHGKELLPSKNRRCSAESGRLAATDNPRRACEAIHARPARKTRFSDRLPGQAIASIQGRSTGPAGQLLPGRLPVKFPRDSIRKVGWIQNRYAHGPAGIRAVPGRPSPARWNSRNSPRRVLRSELAHSP